MTGSGFAGERRDSLGASIARFAEEVRGVRGKEQAPEGLAYGRLRVFCSEDIDEILEAGGTCSIIYPMRFKMGYPFCMARPDFEDRMAELRRLTSRARENGLIVLAYVAQNQGTSDPGDVWSWRIAGAWRDPQAWERYADLYGPRPEQSPDQWLQRKEDGSYGLAEWVPPSRPDRRSYSFQGCPHSPGFRQYVLGIMNLLLSAGIRGIYWDNSEIANPYSEDSKRCFREFLAARYDEAELRDRFGIGDFAQIAPTRDRSNPLWPESTLFLASSQAEFHRHLLEHARKQDPGFIVSGNLYAPSGFQHAVANGADIQIGGIVHGFLYSELAAGTRTPEAGQRNLPGIRDGIRTAVAPLNKTISASSRNGAAMTYSHYPESPSPVPTREALYNLQRLAVAEAHANHVCFRRVEHHHAEEVRRGAKNVYDLLRRAESDLLGAEMAANIGVVASLQNVYHRRYSYHLEASRALADAGFAHEIVVPRDLEPGRLSRYRVIVLPNTAVLSAEQYGAILEYQGRGGSVIAFGEIGTLDLRGDAGPGQRDSATSAFRMVDIDPGKLAEDNPLNPKALWKLQEGWGKGLWPDSLHSTMEGLVAGVEELAGAGVLARRHAPDSVEITVMRKPGSDALIVHVVNYGVDLAGTVTPARDVVISVASEDQRIEGVQWRALDGVEQSLEATVTGGRTQFVIPEVAIYGIALLRTARG